MPPPPFFLFFLFLQHRFSSKMALCAPHARLLRAKRFMPNPLCHPLLLRRAPHAQPAPSRYVDPSTSCAIAASLRRVRFAARLLRCFARQFTPSDDAAFCSDAAHTRRQACAEPINEPPRGTESLRGVEPGQNSRINTPSAPPPRHVYGTGKGWNTGRHTM